MKSVNRKKYLFSNVVTIAIGNLASSLIAFFLVPLYTNVLTTSEYGIVDLLYTMCNFLVPLFTFNIVEAIIRFTLDKENNNDKILSISLVSIVFMILSSLIVLPVLNLFPSYKELSMVFYIYLITLGSSRIFLYYLKGKEKLNIFSLGNALYTLLVGVFSIVLLLKYNMGIIGYFWAYIISNVIIIIYSFAFGNIIKDFNKFDFDKILFRKMVKYSILLIPTTFLWWIMNFMDRIMVTNMVSASANGIYAVSYKIPSILTVLSSIFTQAWLFSAIREKGEKDEAEYTNNVFYKLSCITILCASFLIVFVKYIYKWYVAVEYFEAWKYVSILIIGYIFLTLSTFISTSYNVNKDSKGMLASATIGAIGNLILNFALIPFIGVYGAAIATTISYILVFIYRIINTKKYIKINLGKEFYLGILVIFINSALLYLPSNYLMINIILFITLLFIYRKVVREFINVIIKRKKS